MGEPEKTKVNFEIFKAIGRYIKSQHRGPLAIFDIGCGIGSLFDLLTHELRKQNDVIFEGCEPSAVNYGYFLKKAQSTFKKSTKITVKNTDFLSVITKTKFDFITAVYVFPHFIAEQLPMTARKIHTMLKSHGRFLLVVANESYLRNRLQSEKKIFIEKNTLLFHKRKFEEWMHYSDIRQLEPLSI